jgi:hypothetical protein
MTKPLIQWFIYTLIVGVFAAYVASRTLDAGAEYLKVFLRTRRYAELMSKLMPQILDHLKH